MDFANNTVTLIGNVVVKYGLIDIHAEKVVIFRPDGKDGQEILDGYGNPVTFKQIQENGKIVRSRSQKVHYETANDLVILTGHAYLEQLDSNVQGDRITFLVKKQKIEAFSEKGKRVTTVLLLKQLQKKNGLKTPVESVK